MEDHYQVPRKHGDEQKYAQFHNLSQEDYNAAVNAYLSEQDANLGNTTTGQTFNSGVQVDEQGNVVGYPTTLENAIIRDEQGNITGFPTGRGLPLGTTTTGQTLDFGHNEASHTIPPITGRGLPLRGVPLMLNL